MIQLDKHPQDVGLKLYNTRTNPLFKEDPERLERNKRGNWVVKYSDGAYGIEDPFNGFWK